MRKMVVLFRVVGPLFFSPTASGEKCAAQNQVNSDITAKHPDIPTQWQQIAQFSRPLFFSPTASGRKVQLKDCEFITSTLT